MSELTKEQRRELMPISSEFLEAFYREFQGLEWVKAQEAGHQFEWARK
jgi:hypothetical protein